MECIVLAGGTPRPGESLYAETRGRPKALLDVGGRPMIDRVVDALRAAEAIDRLIVVGLADTGAAGSRADAVVPDSGSLIANLYSGIGELRDPASRAAYCWSDVPLLRGEMVDRFVAATDPRCDVSAGLVPRDRLEERYPGVEDLWLRLHEGQFIAADFGTFQAREAERMRPELERLAPLRKSALRQARAVGLPLLFRYLAGRLTIPFLRADLERRFRIRCQVLVAEDPELGLDVDTLADLEICRRACEAS